MFFENTRPKPEMLPHCSNPTLFTLGFSSQSPLCQSDILLHQPHIISQTETTLQHNYLNMFSFMCTVELCLLYLT